MLNPKVIMAATLAVLVSSGAHAATGVHIQAGTKVDCLPFPSIETLNRDTVYENGKPAFGGVLTCSVIEGQSVPKQSKFVGRLVAGTAPNTYSFVWEVLQLPGADGSIQWKIADGDLSSRLSGPDRVRVSFNRDLNVTNQ